MKQPILCGDGSVGQASGITGVLIVIFAVMLPCPLILVRVLFAVFIRIVVEIEVGRDQHFEEVCESGGESFETDRKVQELVHTAFRVTRVDAIVVTITGFADDNISGGPVEFLIGGIRDGRCPNFAVDGEHISGVSEEFDVADGAFVFGPVIAAGSPSQFFRVSGDEVQPLPGQWCAADFFKFPTNGWLHENAQQAGEDDSDSL
jgi:hypothetical protein